MGSGEMFLEKLKKMGQKYQNVGEVKEIRTREVLDLLNESLGALIFEPKT